MKELLILRHAKSAHSNPMLGDHDRPLNDRGRAAAPRIGRLIAREGLHPDLVLCSSATRTVQTAELVKAASGTDARMETIESLYLAPARTILETLVHRAGDSDRALVVGHNPGMEDVLDLLGLGRVEMPTASLAHVRIDIADWTMLGGGDQATLERFWLARSLED